MTYLLHNIGLSPCTDPRIASNYNTIEEILSLDPNVQLTFDGVYTSVWENRYALAYFKKPPLLFVTGDYMGKDNSFDTGMPRETFCTWQQIEDICAVFGEELEYMVGWHTKSHPDLTQLLPEDLEEEIRPPFPMKYFAYPYGRFNEAVFSVVREMGYEYAYSVTQGKGGDYSLVRQYL